MSQTTNIQWCDSTVNPVMGCAGCELWNGERKTCYAGQLHRLRKTHKGFSPNFDTPKLFPGRMATAARWADLSGTKRPDKPWLNGLPRLIFVSDMGDALSERSAIGPDNARLGGGVPFGFLKAEIIDAVSSGAGQRHTWLWLTKRPHLLRSFSQWLDQKHGLSLPANLWVGTTVTGTSTLPRIDELRHVGGKATVRFVSAEPLWGAVKLGRRLHGISWVVVGGESRQGSEAKPFQIEWAQALRDECAKAGAAFFLKQLGTRPTFGGRPLTIGGGFHAGDWTTWPRDLRVREMPTRCLPVSRGRPRGQPKSAGT